MLATCIALVGSASAGCTKHDDGTAPASAEALPELVIRDDTPNVLLTWIDARGVGHTEVHAKDVPPEGRAMVRVVVSDRDEGTHDRFYIVDLAHPRGDGAYLAKTIARRAWEDELEKRRAAFLGEDQPAPSTAPSGSAGGGRRAARADGARQGAWSSSTARRGATRATKPPPGSRRAASRTC